MIKYLILLFLLVGCGSKVEDKKALTKMAQLDCKCSGGLAHASFMNLNSLTGGYTTVLYRCKKSPQRYMLSLNDYISNNCDKEPSIDTSKLIYIDTPAAGEKSQGEE